MKRSLFDCFRSQRLRSSLAVIALAALTLAIAAPTALAQDEPAATTPAATDSNEWMFVVYWGIAFAGSIIALGFALKFFKSVMAADEGN